MSIQQRSLALASAPALAIYERVPQESGRRGTILFYHGFGGSKEQLYVELAVLAAAGFLAVGVDAVGHGERRYPDFVDRFPPFEERFIGDLKAEAEFLSVVHATAREIPQVIDALLGLEWAHQSSIGVAGISLGGFITYAAIIADRRIQAATPVVGSPAWKLPWRESPHLHLARFFPTALLSQTARADTRVSSQAVRAFHDRLAPYYVIAPERLHLIEYPHVDHDLCEKDWIQVRQNLVAWFERFLIGEDHV